jgi:hypothetical protein
LDAYENLVEQVKQGFAVNEAVRWGKANNFDFIMHLDVDEVLFPQKPHVSVQDVINANLTASERRFDNFEAVPERPDVPNKFKNIDLFKVILMQQVLDIIDRSAAYHIARDGALQVHVKHVNRRQARASNIPIRRARDMFLVYA